MILIYLYICSKFDSTDYVIVRSGTAYNDGGGTNISGDTIFCGERFQLGDDTYRHILNHDLWDTFKW